VKQISRNAEEYVSFPASLFIFSLMFHDITKRFLDSPYNGSKLEYLRDLFLV
jgi:hypothetical protein